MNLNRCFLQRFAGLGVKPHAGNRPRPSVKQARNTAWRLTEQDLVLHHPLDDFTDQVRGTIEQATCAAFITSGEPLQEQLRTGDRKTTPDGNFTSLRAGDVKIARPRPFGKICAAPRVNTVGSSFNVFELAKDSKRPSLDSSMPFSLNNRKVRPPSRPAVKLRRVFIRQPSQRRAKRSVIWPPQRTTFSPVLIYWSVIP